MKSLLLRPSSCGRLSVTISLGFLFFTVLCLCDTQPPANNGIPLDLGDTGSIKAAARITAQGMMNTYTGDQPGQVPGLWPGPYYWWEAGAAFGALVDYWFYTGDTTFCNSTTKGLLFQVGENQDYMPSNQSKSLGNDDQCFWGLAVMAAAEKKYPDPPPNKPQWLALAQAVFNTQAKRWDESTCGGGLRWQIFTFNNGFNYKNTVSNGCFFQLAARLARYTGNSSYAEWASKAYDWTHQIGLKSNTYQFFDGAVVEAQCTQINKIQWSYNAGLYLAGAAFMYNHTNGDPTWKQRVDGILGQTKVFFTTDAFPPGPPQGQLPVETGIMMEVACEPYGRCNVDQRSFKAYLARFMALTLKMAPYTRDYILPKLQKSAQFAAKRCNGPPGTMGKTCSLTWYSDDWQGRFTGLGEQMAAMEVIQNNLIDYVPAPLTAVTGGTSKGDPAAGGEPETGQPVDLGPTTSKDRVGAGFLTTLVLFGILGGAWWMVA